MLYKNVELYNIAEIETTHDGVRLCRIPSELREKLHDRTQTAAYYGCATEIRFVLDSGNATLRLRRDRAEGLNGTGVAEVYYGAFQAPYQINPCYITESGTDIVIPRPKNLALLREISAREKMPYSPDLVRVLLPYDAGNVLIDITGDVRPPQPDMVPRKRYLAYGSSITHGGSAVHPSGSYAMQTARQLGADLINLGFAGGARMDAEIARYIAGRSDWDFATLEMGVNVIGEWDAEAFQSRVDEFVGCIAAAHPDKWIFCTDLFLNDSYWTENERRDAYKRIVREKVRQMNRPKLVYVPGDRLLTRWQGLSSDLLHPSEEGFAEITRNFTDLIRRTMHP
ncbi:MAG: GDSL-type esterase/lipase family protein [Acetanaerobacterium sp.]